MTSAADPPPWYEQAFGADYRRVYPHRDLEAARPEVEFLLAHGIRGRVLDLCCGFGRHVLLLREAGLEAFGLDLSKNLLAQARELPGWERHLRGRLVRADMTRVPFAAGSFDGLVNLFSSFGYLGAAGDGRVLAEVARVLRPDGLALLDLMNPARVRAGLVPESLRAGGDFELRERRSLEEGGARVVKAVELRYADGRIRRWREDVRLYDDADLEALLRAAGLAARARYGDFEGGAASADAPRRIVLARRL